MVARNNGRPLECVLLDLNTQLDFLGSAGACRVQNIEALIHKVRRVIAWAKWNHVPVISSVDSHRCTEATHDGFPQHCIDGTPGQRKLPCTLFGSRIRVEGDNTLSIPANLFRRYQQVIFRKRTHDLFGNPKADRFLTQLPTSEYILFGVGLEYSIKALALGLMARNKKVIVVVDCCGFWSRPEGTLALRQMNAKGARLVTADELLSRRPKRWMRYPLHHSPDGNGSNGKGNGRGARPAKGTGDLSGQDEST
jgi:nicotinamidase-related amidase